MVWQTRLNKQPVQVALPDDDLIEKIERELNRIKGQYRKAERGSDAKAYSQSQLCGSPASKQVRHTGPACYA